MKPGMILAAGILALGTCALAQTPGIQGFETDTIGWTGATRVGTGTDSVSSKTGAFHAEVGDAFTRWNGYHSTFPTGGYTTSVDVYLNLNATSTNDTRFDWDSAINDSSGHFRRDFVFNAGFYNDSVAPGSGNRFVITGSNNAGRSGANPRNLDRNPFVITTTGWYTFQHTFRDSGSGILAVDLTILDAFGAPLHSWTLGDPSDVIGTTVGGNRYGWFASNEFTFLAIDNSSPAPVPDTAGTWSLDPSQTLYTTSVQQPINADGSSIFKSSKNGVIPVKFALSTGVGPVVFESLLATGSYSALSFTPSVPTTFGEFFDLSAGYTFTTGDNHGGSLRWSVRVSPTQSIFIYYGDAPNFTNSTLSGANMIGQADLRYDTSQVGGTFYDTYANAVALAGNMSVVRASLVLDGGWGGDQRLTLGAVSANGNAFVPATVTPLAPTCVLPSANIKVTRTAGATPGAVDEVISIQPKDDNGIFRIVGCNYMYNLATSSLGPGTYKVEVVINGLAAAGAATFKVQ